MRSDLCTLLLLLLVSTLLAAQGSEAVENILENFQSEDLSQTDFLEILSDLQDDPIDLNSAPAYQILRIPFFNEELARAIVRYRREEGRFTRFSDLLDVPGFSAELLQAVTPYVRLQPLTSRRPALNYRLQMGRPLHSIRGFEENRYHNPLYIYQRLRWQPRGNLQIGLLSEKDSGEERLSDFTSYYLNFEWEKARSDLLIGDFSIEAGQQLVMGSAYGSPLTIDSNLPFTRPALRWRPRSAVDENAFLRGIAWQYAPSDRYTFLAAFSRHPIDATLAPDSLTVSSLYTAGYHRSDSEAAKRDRLEESVLSAIAVREFQGGSIGMQATGVRYSLPIQLGGRLLPERAFYSSGWYRWRQGLLQVQGEAALLEGQYPALQQALLVALPRPRLTYGALFYYYHPRYWAYHGRAFGKTAAPPANELGFFLSISARLSGSTEAAAYFHSARPAGATEEFPFLNRSRQVQISQVIGRSEVILRFTQRVRRRDAGIALAPEQRAQILRLQVNSSVAAGLRLSHRLEVAWADSTAGSTRGYGVSFYQDARYNAGKNLRFQARWTQFDVPDFDERLYEFENDLPGTFRNILLTRRGFKWFFLLNYRPSPHYQISLKYREMFFPEETQVGSGLDTVLGNRKRELRGQLQILY